MPTQIEIAKHFGVSERRTRDILKELTLDWNVLSMDELRFAYLNDLREKAAGRGGSDQESLTRARTREANASAELKTLLVKEKAGQLLLVDDIEPGLIEMVTAARTELLALPVKLSSEFKALYDVDVDQGIIEEHIHDALNHLGSRMQEGGQGGTGAGYPHMETAS